MSTLAHKERCKRYYRANKAAILAYQKEYYAENKEKISSRDKAYRQKNSEHILKRVKSYAAKYPERVRAYKKKYDDKNKDEARIRVKSRRAVIAGCTVDERGVKRFYETARNTYSVSCYWCQTLVRGQDCHIDHIIPLSKGGKHAVENLCTSCCSCNQKKSGKLPHEWRTLPQMFLSV
jgi:5-methylcytosine-specific restriction endonuclease McrA